MRHDWIAHVESVYRGLEEPSHERWLGDLATSLAPAFGGPVFGAIFFLDERDRFRHYPVGHVGSEQRDAAITGMEMSRDLTLRVHRGPPYSSLSQALGPRWQAWLARWPKQTFPIRDMIGIVARDGGPWGVTLSTPLKRTRRVSAAEGRPWIRLASHVHAALRLRFKLHGEPERPTTNAYKVDAVLAPSGRALHAERAAQPHLGRLAQAVASIERARGRLRSDSTAALEAWRCLVDGEYSLIDSFESDGRRFLVARKNPVTAPRVPLLSLTERRILALRARGHGVKVIAYETGWSPATVSRMLARALRRVGAKSIVHWAER